MSENMENLTIKENDTKPLIDQTEIKIFLRIDSQCVITMLDSIASTAVRVAENFLGYSFSAKTIGFDSYTQNQLLRIPIKYPKKVVSAQILSRDDSTMLRKIKCVICPKRTHFSLNSIPKETEYVRISYETGPQYLHPQIRQGIMMHIAEMYDNPERMEMSDNILKLYYPYRRIMI